MALVRIIAATFYARHDTATPVRATLISLASNIALKLILVWGFHLGLAGIALGTALGAWINIGILTWLGRSRALLAIETIFLRALPPSLLAAVVAGAGAWLGARLGEAIVMGPHADEAALLCAMICAGLGYGLMVFLFRTQLPLGRLAQRRS
jgi:putative peptidoglycan lipid II flippase